MPFEQFENPSIPSVEKPEQNEEADQEKIESPTSISELNKKTAEITALMEKSLEESLTKNEKKRLKEINKELDQETLDFCEEDVERTWNFLQEMPETKAGKRKSPLTELREKTTEITALMEKSLEHPLNKVEKKRLQEINKQLDEETLNFVEEKVERKWNFLQEQQEEEEEKKRRENDGIGREESKVIENRLAKLKESRQKGGSLVNEAINLIQKEIGGPLTREEEKRVEEIKNKLGERIFSFIDGEVIGATAFRSRGAKGKIETEEHIQELINMKPEEMEKEAKEAEGERLQLKKIEKELRNRK